MTTHYIGIDPGASGGIASISADGEILAAEKFGDTPHDIAEQFRRIVEGQPFAMLERVHSMPRQGVSSSFKFGQSFGFLIGLLVGTGTPHDYVTPQRWQKLMGCMTRGDKNVSKAKAQQLFTGVKITHAIADALLIAEACRKIRLGLTG
jgi:crossover junction endodeoxyribonuclease RuvC